MINCPKCESTLLVTAEAIFTQNITFDYRKKSHGIKKKSVLPKSKTPEEMRVFLECNSCEYATDNLYSGTDTIRNRHPELLKQEKEIDLILDQINEMV